MGDSHQKSQIHDAPSLNSLMVFILAVVGLPAGVPGEWISTGGGSIMLP